jgi:hypothetical protein
MNKRKHVVAIFCALLLIVGRPSLGLGTSTDTRQTNSAISDSSATNLSAPQDPGPPPNADPAAFVSVADQHSDLWRYMTSYEFALAVLILLFGTLVIFSASRTLSGKEVTPEQALRFYGVIVIIVGTILLIVAGLTNNQIAPAVGLFGTLAGYLLGRNQSNDRGVTPVQPDEIKNGKLDI